MPTYLGRLVREKTQQLMFIEHSLTRKDHTLSINPPLMIMAYWDNLERRQVWWYNHGSQCPGDRLGVPPHTLKGQKQMLFSCSFPLEDQD